MKQLFPDYRKYAYLMIFSLLAMSVFFVFSPTGLVTFVSGNNLVDTAFKSEEIRAFAANNPDFKVILEELTAEKIALLQQEHPQLYSNLPTVKLYQMILDAKEKALIIILNEDAVFKILEVNV